MHISGGVPCLRYGVQRLTGWQIGSADIAWRMQRDDRTRMLNGKQLAPDTCHELVWHVLIHEEYARRTTHVAGYDVLIDKAYS